MIRPGHAQSNSWLAATLVGALLIAGCSSNPSPKAVAPATVQVPGTYSPVPTVIATTTGTWAALPMGRLDDPANTFWQLFYRPHGATTWTNRVEATATATNGGLAIAGAGGGPAVVGVRPYDRLLFSPLVSTANGGRKWRDGLLPMGLAPITDAIAATQSQAIAAVANRGGTTVLAAEGSLSKWRPLVSQAKLAATTAGRACHLRSISAVAYHGNAPTIGARCATGRTIGVLSLDNGHWQMAGPALANGAGATRTAVLQLLDEQGTLTGLFAESGTATALVAGWSADGAQTWQMSPLLVIPAGGRIRSYGPDGLHGVYVLSSTSAGRVRLQVIKKPGGAWRALPSPPAGTEAVALTPGGPAQALAVKSATLSVWSFSSPSMRWTKSQSVHVPMSYGSSS